MGNRQIMLEVLLIVHATSTWNKLGLKQGQNDTPLSSEGKEMAKKLASRFEFGEIDRIISSDLSRAIETIRPTAEKLGLPIEKEIALRAGRWADSASQPDIKQLSYHKKYETKADVNTRFIKYMNSFAQQNKHKKQKIIMVSHSGNIDLYLQTLIEKSKSKIDYKRYRTALNHLIFKDEKWQIIKLDDDKHLEGLSKVAKQLDAG
jgi:broad specificity phosphatase PhoE